MKSRDLDSLKSKIRASKPAVTGPDYSTGLSSGCTLLNLACSGRPNVAFLPGYVYVFVGDSESGKTWCSLQTLAEASINKHYAGYRLIYNNRERGALMNIAANFGKRLADRIEFPELEGTIEAFYRHILKLAKEDKPFIEVLDSEDALTSEDEIDAIATGKSGFGLSKAKKNSSGLRVANNTVESTKSLLFLIKQTRQNIGFGAQFNPKTYSGGLAIGFYPTLTLWFSVREEIKRQVLGKKRIVGSVLQVKVKKNRETGRKRPVELLFYPNHGLDEVGSNVRFLIDEGHWPESGGIVQAPEFKFSGSEEKLVQKIEEDGREKELVLLVTETWERIEEACEVTRKSRY